MGYCSWNQILQYKSEMWCSLIHYLVLIEGVCLANVQFYHSLLLFLIFGFLVSLKIEYYSFASVFQIWYLCQLYLCLNMIQGTQTVERWSEEFWIFGHGERTCGGDFHFFCFCKLPSSHRYWWIPQLIVLSMGSSYSFCLTLHISS